ncbi:putative membrane protein, partial [Vibrio parahaemolyticus V-223/04]
MPSILVSATALIVLTIAFDALYMLEREASILFALAVSIALIGFRTYCQSLSDRSQISNVLLLVLAPTMGLVTLFYADEFMHGYALYWTLFCALIAAHYAFLSQRLRPLALECSAVVHALISGVA